MSRKTILIQKLDCMYPHPLDVPNELRYQEPIVFAKMLQKHCNFDVTIVADRLLASSVIDEHGIMYMRSDDIDTSKFNYHLLWNGWFEYSGCKRRIVKQIKLLYDESKAGQKLFLSTDNREQPKDLSRHPLDLSKSIVLTQARNHDVEQCYSAQAYVHMPLQHLPLFAHNVYAKEILPAYDICITTAMLREKHMSEYRVKTFKTLDTIFGSLSATAAVSHRTNGEDLYFFEREDIELQFKIPYRDISKWLNINARFCIVSSHEAYIKANLTTNRLAECITAGILPLIEQQSYCGEFDLYESCKNLLVFDMSVMTVHTMNTRIAQICEHEQAIRAELLAYYLVSKQQLVNSIATILC